MNSYFSRLLWLNNFKSSCFINLLLLIFLLGLTGLSWLINGFLIILGIITIIPVISLLIFKLWLKYNLVYDNCPACSSKLIGFRNMECYCFNCGEVFQMRKDKFRSNGTISTVDVEVINLSNKQLDEPD